MNSIVAFADCFILMEKSWYLSFPQFEYYSFKQNWKMSRIRSSFSCGYKTSNNKKKGNFITKADSMELKGSVQF